MESWLFLAIIAGIALLAKNQNLAGATLVVMVIKAVPFVRDQVYPYLEKQGINAGVFVITVAILVPVATGRIGFAELKQAFHSPLGWVAVICGIVVALLSARGVQLIGQSPEVTVALVVGTIIGVVFFKGLAAGPVIAAGITTCVMLLLRFFHLA